MDIVAKIAHASLIYKVLDRISKLEGQRVSPLFIIKIIVVTQKRKNDKSLGRKA